MRVRLAAAPFVVLAAAASIAVADSIAEPALGVRFDGPAGWARTQFPGRPQAASAIVALAAPADAAHPDLLCVLTVQAQPSKSKGPADEAKVLDQTIQFIRTRLAAPPANGKFEDAVPATIDGHPGRSIVYTIEAGPQKMKLKQWYVIANDRFYSLTNTAPAEMYDARLAEAERAILSTKFEAATSQPTSRPATK